MHNTFLDRNIFSVYRLVEKSYKNIANKYDQGTIILPVIVLKIFLDICELYYYKVYRTAWGNQR